MTSQCDLCAYYWIDEEDGTGECQVNLDEDDLARMLSGSSDSCPYFQMDDEYKIVRKQMQKQSIREMHRDSVYRRVSLDGIVKEQIKEVMEVAEQMSEEVLQELEKSFCNTI